VEPPAAPTSRIDSRGRGAWPALDQALTDGEAVVFRKLRQRSLEKRREALMRVVAKRRGDAGFNRRSKNQFSRVRGGR